MEMTKLAWYMRTITNEQCAKTASVVIPAASVTGAISLGFTVQCQRIRSLKIRKKKQ